MGKIKEQEYTTVGDNEILLGFSPYDKMEPVCIPFNPKKRISLIIGGDNSAGKSVLGRSIVFDQLHNRFGRNILDVSPKGDTHNIVMKNRIPWFKKRLADFKIKPKAYQAKFISPKVLDVPWAWAKTRGIEYSLGMDNFVKLPKSIRYDLLVKAWTKDEKAPAIERALLDIFLCDDPPESIGEFKKRIDKMNKPPPNLENQLIAYEKTDVIANNGVNYPKLLAENGVLSIETGLSDPEKDTLADIFVEDAVMSCLQDRIISVASENKEGYLHKPFTFFMDEADVFANKMKSTSSLLTQLLTKYRETNPEKRSKGIETYVCDSIILSQHIAPLSNILVRESDWIIMPKLTDEHDGEALRARGLDGVDLYDLGQLEFGREHPKEFVAISKDKEILHFKPLPSASFM